MVDKEQSLLKDKKSIPNGNGVYILAAQFGKKKKTSDEIVRCFLVGIYLFYKANYHFINKTQIKENENKERKYLKYLKRIALMVQENTSILLIQTKADPLIIKGSKNIIESIMSEIQKDNCFFKIISELNRYSYDEITYFKKIMKNLIKISSSNKIESCTLFISKNLLKIVKCLLYNIQEENIKFEYSVYIVCKILRLTFKIDDYFLILMNNDIFLKLYQFVKSNKFILVSEIFKTLFSIIEKPKINKNIFSDYLNNKKDDICKYLSENYFNSGNKSTDEEAYFIKRESLTFFNQVLDMSEFEGFKDYFTNNSNCLKMILIQFNDDCLKIKFQSIKMIYHFFNDIESKKENIKKLLIKNKNNFDFFFSSISEHLEKEENSEIKGLKNFIYYEFEKLINSSF